MKKYLVSKDVVDAFLDGSWDDLEDFRSDDSWGSDEIVELPPGAKVLTRKEVVAWCNKYSFCFSGNMVGDLFGADQ